MGIIVTPKSNAEVNQLQSLLHSAGYTNYAVADECTHFKVNTPAVLWSSFKEYCHIAKDIVLDGTHMTVNELGTYLQRS